MAVGEVVVIANVMVIIIYVSLLFFFNRVALTGPRSVVIIGYIPGPNGILFAIAPTHIIEWQFCHPIMHLGIYGYFDGSGTCPVVH